MGQLKQVRGPDILDDSKGSYKLCRIFCVGVSGLNDEKKIVTSYVLRTCVPL